tara:strand:- start:21181 stop:22161 length:981 start_codon:yes stop_codon:yes gene_type:complete
MEKSVRDVPTMFTEMMISMSMLGEKESSRNGDVITLQEPLTITVKNPLHRVLLDPIRQANPYFHVMEFIWMMSGSNRADWIQHFNSRFVEYADQNNSKNELLIHGAYGYRWRKHFGLDQILNVIELLKENANTRRAVLSMWDGAVDLNKEHNDLPCNTHIYFRTVKDKLNMTVCNRSNDVVWGMTGANAVHMTMLHEVISFATGIPIGHYIVFTNNAHMYVDLPNFKELSSIRYPTLPTEDNYGFYETMPIIDKNHSYENLTEDASDFVKGMPRNYKFKLSWFNKVAKPMYWAYLERKRGRSGEEFIEQIKDLNWKTACIKWGEWK